MSYFFGSLEHRRPALSNPGKPWHRLLPKDVKENHISFCSRTPMGISPVIFRHALVKLT